MLNLLKLDIDVTFAYPYAFLLLLIIPFLIIRRYLWGKKKGNFISYSDISFVDGYKRGIRERFVSIPFWLRIFAFMFLIVALARPQKFSTGEKVYTEGIDIAIVLDISGSMLAEDFKPNRMEAAKRITEEFIDGRVGDQIGLVIFSREAFTQCPLTIDYVVLKNLLKEVKSGMIEDGTAIGNAIANGVNRLKDSKAKSRVMIVLTDGMNNAGEINPLTAAELAKQFNIRVYTIGVGTIGQAPFPFQTPFGTRYQMVPVDIDEPLMKKISEMTGANYFRATNNKKLQDIYKEIDKLEKTKKEVYSYRSRAEMYHRWLLIGLILLGLEVILSKTIFRKLP